VNTQPGRLPGVDARGRPRCVTTSTRRLSGARSLPGGSSICTEQFLRGRR